MFVIISIINVKYKMPDWICNKKISKLIFETPYHISQSMKINKEEPNFQ